MTHVIPDRSAAKRQPAENRQRRDCPEGRNSDLTEGEIKPRQNRKSKCGNPNDYRFAFMLRPPVEKRPYKAHAAFDVLRQMVKRCIEEKRFRDPDVESTSQVLWASAHGTTSLLIQRPAFPWAPKNKLLTQLIGILMAGLMAAPNATEQKKRRHAKHSR